MDDESPVKRVEVEHEDGTVRVLEGKEAMSWVQWVATAINFAQQHGGIPPQVDWREG